jgi:triacylglycerol lipase
MASDVPQLWREARAGRELGHLLRSAVWRSPPSAPVPDQPVLLIPGLLASDSTLTLLARWLKRAGYAPRRAGIAVNVDCSEAEMARLVDRLEKAHERADRRALVVGHSRGGVFARALAVRRPDLVGGIVTLGSPLVDPLLHVHPFLHLQLEFLSSLGDLGLRRVVRHTCADATLFDSPPPHRISRALLGRAQRRMEAGEACCQDFWRDFRGPFPREVPFVSIYSRADGIVAWAACLDPAAEHVEVDSSHCGMAASARVYPRIADALARMSEPGARKRLAA